MLCVSGPERKWLGAFLEMPRVLGSFSFVKGCLSSFFGSSRGRVTPEFCLNEASWLSSQDSFRRLRKSCSNRMAMGEPLTASSH